MRKMIDTKCDNCGDVILDKLMDPEKVPACAKCGGYRRPVMWTNAQSEGIRVQAATVIGDDIPGGILIEHGICKGDGTPVRYYSKSDIRKAAKAKGLIWGGDHARHATSRESDKAPHTVRFVGLPAALNQEEEDARVKAWHEHEAQLQEELRQANDTSRDRH